MDSIEIIDYQKEHQPYFEKLNREWIETYFWLEELDIYILQHPEKALLQNGGCILSHEHSVHTKCPLHSKSRANHKVNLLLHSMGGSQENLPAFVKYLNHR